MIVLEVMVGGVVLLGAVETEGAEVLRVPLRSGSLEEI